MAGGSYGEFEIARWVGAVFYWLLSGCQNKLDSQLNKKYDSRNAWTGYLIFLLSLSSLLYLVVAFNN
jgi:hypothetical protein